MLGNVSLVRYSQCGMNVVPNMRVVETRAWVLYMFVPVAGSRLWRDTKMMLLCSRAGATSNTSNSKRERAGICPFPKVFRHKPSDKVAA